jgi:membrane fusion protein (multidrug efflux system)
MSTDDAYVEGPIAPVSAKIAGQVVEVLIRDNETVKAGQVLVRLDARDHKAKAEQLRAAVLIADRRFRAAVERIALGKEVASSQVTQARAATMRADAAKQSANSLLEGSRATVMSRRAALASAIAERDRSAALRDRATGDLARARELFGKELVARQFVDYAETEARAVEAGVIAAGEKVVQARRDLEFAEADERMRHSGYEPQQIGLKTAEARAVEARAQEIQAEALHTEVRVRQAERDLAQAQLREAEADLSAVMLTLEYTEIRAPATGVVSKKTVEPGQVVQPGQPLMALVALHEVWVLANFKETQLQRMRPGMRARVVVDGYPDRVWSGRIDSIAAGTGSRFSLLPPENATGNWVKVVQRVPVKIVLDSDASSNPQMLRAGMSVVVTVQLR